LLFFGSSIDFRIHSREEREKERRKKEEKKGKYKGAKVCVHKHSIE